MLGILSRRLWSRSRNGLIYQAVDNSFQCRHLGVSTGGHKDEKNQGSTDDQNSEEDDEFAIADLESPDDDEETVESTLHAISQDVKEITPQIASDLVARMVEATKKRIDRSQHRENIISHISSHTISVMRATRITTNNIKAAGSDYLPHDIEKKVTAELNVEQLNLSTTAQEALKILSGPRWKGSYIKISCTQYPSMEENRAQIVSQIDRLVAAAKVAVGEAVDMRPLVKWPEVVEEVQRQAKEEIEETGNVSLVLGGPKL